MEAFRHGLSESGYVEGQNIAIEVRYAGGRTERFADLIGDLIQLQVNALVTTGAQAGRVAQQMTKTIPIVALTDDIVGEGLVASLARPGGNTTGVTILGPELNLKRLQLLKDLLPKVSRVALLWDPSTGTSQLRAMDDAAQSLGVKLEALEVRTPDDFVGAFQAAKKERAEALNVLASPFLFAYHKTIIDLAAKHRLPALFQFTTAAQAGGLMAYGPSLYDLWQQGAYQVGRILKGAKPADLPVLQPTKFELAINLKTAKALGLTIPKTILIRADQAIQ
jgi:putative ABC transport system substrate-binding protein